MQYFKGVPIEKIGYCKCRQQSAIFTENEEFGYWDVCCDCKKPLDSITFNKAVNKIHA